MVRAVVRSHKADEQVVVALGGDGKGEGLGQSLAEILVFFSLLPSS